MSVFLRNALSHDGRLAAVQTSSELRVFDLTTGRDLYKLAKGGQEVLDSVFVGGRLVTVDDKQIIDVWEAKTGKLARSINHGAPAGYLATSADGRWLAVLEHRYHDGPQAGHWPEKDRVHVWDLQAGGKKHELTLGANHWFRSAYFLAGGKRLLTSSLRQPHGSELTVWDMESGQRLREIRDVYGNSIAVSPDGRRVAVGYVMGKFDLWDLETGHRVSNEDGRHVWAATVFCPATGGHIYTLGYHSFSTWDARTGKRLESMEMPRSYDWNTPRRSFSPDGRYAVSFSGDGKDFQAIVWDVAARKQRYALRLPGKEDYVYVDGIFSADSSMLAIWQPLKSRDEPVGRVDSEAVIHIWDVRTGKEVRSFKENKSGWPGQLAFSADGKTLLVAGKHVIGFDVASGKELFSWHMKPLPDTSGAVIAVNGKPIDPNDRCAWRSLAVSPDGSSIACILDGGSLGQPVPERIALFNARTGKLLRRWSDSGKPNPTYCEQIAFSPDGQLLASSDGFAIHLWEMATGKEIRVFQGHRSDIISLAFSGDGRRLASTSWDSTVLVWDLTAPAASENVEKCWADLAAGDARRAHQAVWTLARMSDKALPLLRDRLHSVKPVSRQQLERLIRDLDGDQFAIREKATAELHKLGELAAPSLRRVLEDKPTLEQRRRIEPILAELEAKQPSGEALRSLRAIRVLEQVATPEARRLLHELAGGAEGAMLTREAQAALTRLKRRSP